jgi:hypothetical protein
MRSAPQDGSQIKAVLEVAQPRAVDVHDGDVVRFGREAFGDRRANLACT